MPVAWKLAQLHCDAAAFRRVFDRITYYIKVYLFKLELITDYIRMRNIFFTYKLQLFLSDLFIKHRADRIVELIHTPERFVKLHLPALNTGHLQHIIYKRKKEIT